MNNNDKKIAARGQRAAGTGALASVTDVQFYCTTGLASCQGRNPHLLALADQAQCFAARDLQAAVLARERGDLQITWRLRRRGLLHQAVFWAARRALPGEAGQ